MKVRGRIHTNIFHLMNRLAFSSVLIVIEKKKEKRNKSFLYTHTTHLLFTISPSQPKKKQKFKSTLKLGIELVASVPAL